MSNARPAPHAPAIPSLHIATRASARGRGSIPACVRAPVLAGLAMAASLLALLPASASAAQAASDPAAPPASSTSAAAPSKAPAAVPTTVAGASSVDPKAAATADAAKGTSGPGKEPPKVVCRSEKVTGSKLRTRKVCSTPDSMDSSGDWVREQQARGAIGASAILSGGP